MTNKLTVAMTYQDNVRIYALDTTEIVKEAQNIHNLWPTSAAALGRTLTLGLIMSSMQKADESITIKINGDGPIGQILVESHNNQVRGFVHNPGVYLSNNEGKLLVGRGVGSGDFTVIKDLHLKEPYVSTIPLYTGEIAEDAAMYFLQSEQTKTAVALGVLFDKEGKVSASGGYLIELLPFASDEIITKLENKLAEIEPISSLIDKGLSPIDIINLLGDDSTKVLKTIDLKYGCDCSKERFARGLISLGKKELEDIINDGKEIEINCNFCNTKYIFTIDEIKDLLNKALK